MSALSRPEFHSEEAAFAHLEAIIWADGKACPHCGGMDRLTKVKANPAKRIRMGLWRCGDCKKQFTVKVGTVFEHARLPLHKALQAVYLMTSSKKGISAHQLHRLLEITYKSAWFLAHRIREAMREGALAPFGGGGGIVEVDETFIGREPGMPVKAAYHHKMKVLALVDRRTGRSRAMVIDTVNADEIMPIVRANIDRETHVMADEAGQYRGVGYEFRGHYAVSHKAGEYVRGLAHTNTIEGYFSIFKRGMRGVYQHCGKNICTAIWRSLISGGFNDAARSQEALKGIVGKRLTYVSANERAA